MTSDRFRYDGYDLDLAARTLVCRYSLGERRFVETITLGADGRGPTVGGPGAAAPRAEAADAASRIVYLLAGVSYYKTAAPPVIDLGPVETTDREREFLRTFYLEGLAEMAHRNGLDLSGLELEGPGLARRPPVAWSPTQGAPLVPFGGGIDSIVTAEAVRHRQPGASLFVVSRTGDRFSAIEQAAARSGLPVVRAERRLDPSVLRSADLGFLNGHVPVTGILSSVAVLAAVTGGHGSIVMSNERSASAPTIPAAPATGGGAVRAVNHQWSKSMAFETGFRSLLAATFDPPVEYFSFLRDRSELWVARQFADLGRYHDVFCSCNRAFLLDPARRLDRWCGTCDKCCFVDLVLAPFVGAAALADIFGGREPLADESLEPQFRALLGTGPDAKPFECVGDEEECRVAAILAAARPDRAGSRLLQGLADEAARAVGGPAAAVAVAGRLLSRGDASYVPAWLTAAAAAV